METYLIHCFLFFFCISKVCVKSAWQLDENIVTVTVTSALYLSPLFCLFLFSHLSVPLFLLFLSFFTCLSPSFTPLSSLSSVRPLFLPSVIYLSPSLLHLSRSRGLQSAASQWCPRQKDRPGNEFRPPLEPSDVELLYQPALWEQDRVGWGSVQGQVSMERPPYRHLICL